MTDWETKKAQRDAEKAKYLHWLRELKPGDTFAFGGNNRYGHPPAILKVGRITPTQIVVDPGERTERRYCRKTGAERGGSSYSSIEPVTDLILKKIEHHRLQGWLSSLAYGIGRSDGKKLSTQTLRAMKKAFDDNHVEEPKRD